MIVLYIKNLGEREADFGRITEWNAQRRWLVHVDTRYAEEWQILEVGWGTVPQTFPIPYTNVFPSQPLMLCRSIGAKQQANSPQHWIVTATYSSEPLTQQQKDAQQYENPLDRPVRVKLASTKYNKPCIFDINGTPILNTAGEFFDPPPEFDQSRFTINISKNLEDVPSYYLDLEDAVNSTAFTCRGLTVDPLCAKIMSAECGELQTAQVGEDEIVTYCVFDCSLEIRRETWDLQLLDQGYTQIDSNDSTKRIRIKDDSVPRKDTSKPWPLDGSGGRLSNPNPGNTVLLGFPIYNDIDLGSFLPGLNGNP